MKIVTIYGPAGSGKSSNADALAAHYGCKYVVDEDDSASPSALSLMRKGGGVLVLTSRVTPGAIHIDTALAEIGQTSTDTPQ